MSHNISYDSATQPVNTLAVVPTTITTSEADLYVIKSPIYTAKSQLTIMGSLTLGSATSATFYYYLSNDFGTTWFPVSILNTSTNVIDARQTVVNSSTGVSSVAWVDEVSLGACTAFKVTGFATGATISTYKLVVMARDN